MSLLVFDGVIKMVGWEHHHSFLEHDNPCKMVEAYEANPDFFHVTDWVCFYFFPFLRMLFVLSDAHLLNHT